MTSSIDEVHFDLKEEVDRELKNIDNEQDAIVYWKEKSPCAIHGFPELYSKKGSKVLYHLPQFEMKINPWIQSFINLVGISPRKGINLLINNIWNYPKALQAAQISIVGNYGTGKSNLLNFIVAQHLAKGYRGITFIDRRFEIRNLMTHAWMDWQNAEHPFITNVFLPESYEYTSIKKSSRGNISYHETDDIQRAIQYLKPHSIVAIYTDCYDSRDGSQLRLLNDILEELQLLNNIDDPVIFFHHELSTLIPETPTEGLAKLAREVSDKVLNLRKDEITLATSFHMLSEVYYRVSQKFGFVLQKEPVNRKIMSAMEQAARELPINGVLVGRSGYWVPHKVGYFPETKDKYRIIPGRKKLSYEKGEGKTENVDTKLFSSSDFAALQMLKDKWENGNDTITHEIIAKEIGKSSKHITRLRKKFLSHGLLTDRQPSPPR